MQIIEAYQISVWDGGERHTPGFMVASLEEANKWKTANQYDRYHRVTLVVFDSVAEYLANTREALRKSAYAKLSPLEREALGLTKKDGE